MGSVSSLHKVATTYRVTCNIFGLAQSSYNVYCGWSIFSLPPLVVAIDDNSKSFLTEWIVAIMTSCIVLLFVCVLFIKWHGVSFVFAIYILSIYLVFIVNSNQLRNWSCRGIPVSGKYHITKYFLLYRGTILRQFHYCILSAIRELCSCFLTALHSKLYGQ